MHVNVEQISMMTTKCNIMITVMQYIYNIGALIISSCEFRRDGLHCIGPLNVVLHGLEVVQLQHSPNIFDLNDGCVMCSPPKACSSTTNTKPTEEPKLRTRESP